MSGSAPACSRPLGKVLGGRAYCLVTYDDANGGSVFADLARRIETMAGAPAAAVRNIGPNPDFIGLAESCRLYAAATRPVEAIVALGGGSVMDAAKVLAAADGDFARVRHFLETGQAAMRSAARRSSRSRPRPAPAAKSPAGRPSGTPSGMKKYSLARETLYPEAALVDPLLTLGLPRAHHHQHRPRRAQPCARKHLERERQSGLGDALAETAAREVMDALPLLALDLDNEALRTRLARASLTAGPRLLQHPDRAGARTLLPPHAPFRRPARHRLLVQPAAW